MDLLALEGLYTSRTCLPSGWTLKLCKSFDNSSHPIHLLVDIAMKHACMISKMLLKTSMWLVRFSFLTGSSFGPSSSFTSLTTFSLNLRERWAAMKFLAKLLRQCAPFSPFPHIQYAKNNIQYAIAELIFLYQGSYLMGGGCCLKLYSAIELLVF